MAPLPVNYCAQARLITLCIMLMALLLCVLGEKGAQPSIPHHERVL